MTVHNEATYAMATAIAAGLVRPEQAVTRPAAPPRPAVSPAHGPAAPPTVGTSGLSQLTDLLLEGRLPRSEYESVLAGRDSLLRLAATGPSAVTLGAELCRLLDGPFPDHQLHLLWPEGEGLAQQAMGFRHGRAMDEPPPESVTVLLERARRGQPLPPAHDGGHGPCSLLAAPVPPTVEGTAGGAVLLLLPGGSAGAAAPAPSSLLACGEALAAALELAAGQRTLARGEQSLAISLLTRGVVHELNNLRAGLFSNLDYVGEALQLWAKIQSPMARLVRASILVPELRRYADEVHALDDDEELATLAEDTPDLLVDINDIRLRFQRLVERLDQVSCRSRGLAVEEDLEQALSRVIAEVTQGRGALPEISVRCSEPVHVFTYRQLLERCLAELLQNAIDAAGQLGHVEVRLARSGEQSVVEIRNDGQGLPTEQQERAFVPFYSTRESASNTGVRRGLGLNVALRAATQLGGDVRLLGDDRGTTAVLRLPDPQLHGRTVFLLGRLPQTALAALGPARLSRLEPDHQPPATFASLPGPSLVLLGAGLPVRQALTSLAQLDQLLSPLPVVRYGAPSTLPDCSREQEEELERRIVAEVEDDDSLLHEVRRILTMGCLVD